MGKKIDSCVSNNRKTVLSFDVGIINLAYCIFDVITDSKTDSNTESKTFEIKQWDLINLADGRETCQFIKMNGETCDKIANTVVDIDNHNKYYFCSAHQNKCVLKTRKISQRWWMIPPDDIDRCRYCNKNGVMYSNIIEGQFCDEHQKKIKIQYNLICVSKKCKQEVDYGLYLDEPIIGDGESCGEMTSVFKFGWCSDHYKTGCEEYIAKKSKKIIQNSNKLSLCSIGVTMYKKLDRIVELLKVDEVLIENQPTFINPTMKSISSMLFSYFVMRGLHEKDKTKSTIKTVNYCSPSNKIKVGGDDADKRVKNAKEGKEYKVTKELGLRFCKALIDDRWLKHIETYKKKDDLADAFLQGFIMNFGPVIPTIYAEKIKTVDTNVHQKITKKTTNNDIDDINNNNIDNTDNIDNIENIDNEEESKDNVEDIINDIIDDTIITFGSKKDLISPNTIKSTKSTKSTKKTSTKKTSDKEVSTKKTSTTKSSDKKTSSKKKTSNYWTRKRFYKK